MFINLCLILNHVQCEWNPCQSKTFLKFYTGHLIFIHPRVVKDTIGSIAESEKKVESAARGMEYIIRLAASLSSTHFHKHGTLQELTHFFHVNIIS